MSISTVRSDEGVEWDPSVGDHTGVPMGPWGRYPRNQWYVAAGRDELGRELLSRRLLGEDVLMYRQEDGSPVALRDTCPHRGAPLSLGKLCGDRVVCGYHGLEFDSTGKCVHIPSQKSISRRMHTATYPVVEKWLWIWIWLGDAEKADPALIPTSKAESMLEYHNHYYFAEPIDSNFQLLQDNLLDQTHLPYVHGDNLVSEALRDVAAPEMHIDRYGNTLHVWREIPDYRPTPKDIEALGLEDKEYRYRLTTEIDPPCSFTSWIEWFEPDGTPALQLFYSLPVVPAGPRGCYHFMGVTMPFHYTSPEIIAYWKTIIDEDRKIVEPLQKRADTSPDFAEVSLKSDRAQLLYRKIMAELVRAEELTAS